MGYYQGDFYAGARGDPGFWSFVGGLAKSAVGAIPVVGPTASRVLGRFGGGTMAGAGMAREAGTAIVKSPIGQMVVKHPVLSAAGAAGIAGAAMGVGAERLMGPAGAAPKGYHLCKSMQPGRKHPHPCKSGMYVRNRRMNVCNPRALRRAIRRAHGFTKLAMRTIHLTHPKKKGRFGGFKKARRRV